MSINVCCLLTTATFVMDEPRIHCKLVCPTMALGFISRCKIKTNEEEVRTAFFKMFLLCADIDDDYDFFFGSAVLCYFAH